MLKPFWIIAIAWLIGIAAFFVIFAAGYFMLMQMGVNTISGDDFTPASLMGLTVVAIMAGLRIGLLVGRRFDKPSAYKLATLIEEKATLRGITAGAVLFTLLATPLDLLIMPRTSWFASIGYAVWMAIALGFSVLLGRFVSFHTKRTSKKHAA